MQNTALRDAHFRVEAPGTQHSEFDTASYLAAAQSVVTQMSEEDKPEKVVQQRAYHRSAAHDWCVGIDHLLEVCSGRAIVQLQPKDDVPLLSERSIL